MKKNEKKMCPLLKFKNDFQNNMKSDWNSKRIMKLMRYTNRDKTVNSLSTG